MKNPEFRLIVVALAAIVVSSPGAFADSWIPWATLNPESGAETQVERAPDDVGLHATRMSAAAEREYDSPDMLAIKTVCAPLLATARAEARAVTDEEKREIDEKVSSGLSERAKLYPIAVRAHAMLVDAVAAARRGSAARALAGFSKGEISYDTAQQVIDVALDGPQLYRGRQSGCDYTIRVRHLFMEPIGQNPAEIEIAVQIDFPDQSTSCPFTSESMMEDTAVMAGKSPAVPSAMDIVDENRHEPDRHYPDFSVEERAFVLQEIPSDCYAGTYRPEQAFNENTVKKIVLETELDSSAGSARVRADTSR